MEIYIEKINLAIEYDGIYRHNTDKKIQMDKEKEEILKSNKVNFLRIKETINKTTPVSIKNNVIFYNLESSYKNVDIMINTIINYIQKKFKMTTSIEPNIKNDFISISKQYLSLIKENSIASYSKKLLKEWDYEKNQGISPFLISRGSGKKFWWRCQKNHSWQDSVLHRKHGRGCPYCSGRRISI